MAGNQKDIGTSEVKTEHFSIEMSDFDKLSKDFRNLLNYVPLKLSASITQNVLRRGVTYSQMIQQMGDEMQLHTPITKNAFKQILLDNNVKIT